MAAACFALIGLGLIFFSYANVSYMWVLVPFIILFSIGWGGNVTMRAALLREYFGRSNFGTIHGFTMGMLMLGSITGPLFAGWVFDRFGSYQIAWFTFAGLAFIALIIMATTPPAKNPVRN